MTLRLLLAAAQGGSSFPAPNPPPPTVTTLTAAPNGGNSPWTIPGAFYDATLDKTFITYIDRSGNVEGIEYNHATDTLGGPFTIHAAFEVDAHSSPALLRVATGTFAGRFFALYSKHGSSVINMKVSNSSTTISGWNNASPLDAQLGQVNYTDYQLYEYDGLLYMFVRDEPSPGTDSRWCISTCSPSLPTTGWATSSQVFRITSQRSYVITAMDYTNGKLHFIATNGGTTIGGVTGFSKLGHFYLDIDAGTYHKTDGTQILSPPFTFSEITEIYAGTTEVFAQNVVIDSSGYPVIAARDNISSVDTYVYIRWDGAAWNSTPVASGEPGYVYGGGAAQAYGMAIDDGDPDFMWTIEAVAGQPELFLHRTTDGGATFDSTQVTTGSTQLQVQIICIRTPHADLRVFWQRGTWTSYTNYNVGLVAAGTP